MLWCDPPGWPMKCVEQATARPLACLGPGRIHWLLSKSVPFDFGQLFCGRRSQKRGTDIDETAAPRLDEQMS